MNKISHRDIGKEVFVLFAIGALGVHLGCASAARAQDTVPHGILQSIAIDPHVTENVYTAGDGRVFASADSGQTWTESKDSLLVWSLSVSPADPVSNPGAGAVIYAGTHAHGVMRSTDNGSTWSADPDFKDEIRAVAAGPDSDVAYAGSRSGIYMTDDRGATWRLLSDQLGSGAVQGIAVTESAIYAAKWGQGVYRSVDGGVTWLLGDSGLTDAQIFDLDVHPTDASKLYASTWSGIFASVDAGTNWVKLTSPQHVSEVAFDASDPQKMYASTERNGLFRSLDGGQTWQASTEGLEGVDSFVSIAVDPNGSGTVYAGSVENGLFISNDAGATWSGSAAPIPDSPPASSDTNLSLEFLDLQDGRAIRAGSIARFRITVRNSGTFVARNVTFSANWEFLPAGVGFVRDMPITASSSGGECGNGAFCDLGDLLVGAEITVELQGETGSDLTGEYRLAYSSRADNAPAGDVGTFIQTIDPSTVQGNENRGTQFGGGSFTGIEAVLLVWFALCRLLTGKASRPGFLRQGDRPVHSRPG